MKAVLVAVFIAFGAYSSWVMLQVGYMGVWLGGLDNFGSQQVLLDLVIVCLLACGWMLQDAKARGSNAWPFVLLTMGAGAFGPLLYLILRKPSINA